jgi:hypothetical protein
VNPDQVMLIIIIAMGGWIFAKLLRSPIAEALARRIGGDRLSVAPDDGELAELRTRVSELEERVDFTERVLLQERGQAGELRPGGTT